LALARPCNSNMSNKKIYHVRDLQSFGSPTKSTSQILCKTMFVLVP
jgi:hypothetical protein